MALIAPNLLVAGVASFILTIGLDVASKPDDGFASWHIPMLRLNGSHIYPFVNSKTMRLGPRAKFQ